MHSQMRAVQLLALALAAAATVAEAARLPDTAAHLAADQPAGLALQQECAPGENCSPFVNVTLYGEAQCPFTMGFIADTLAPLLPPGGRPYETFWNIIKFKYVAWGNAINNTHGPPKCQHGPSECRLNRIINCAQKKRPAQREWLPFVVCLARASRDKMEGAVDGCAKDAGLDAIELHTCATGVLGAQLEQQAAADTAALRPPHTYVPWVVVNRIPLGSLDAQLKTIVCAAFPGRKPASCWDTPPDGSALAGSRAARSMAVEA